MQGLFREYAETKSQKTSSKHSTISQHQSRRNKEANMQETIDIYEMHSIQFIIYNVKCIMDIDCVLYLKTTKPNVCRRDRACTCPKKGYNKPPFSMYAVGTGLVPVLFAPCRSSKFPLTL
jgi:hypothetical protein